MLVIGIWLKLMFRMSTFIFSLNILATFWAKLKVCSMVMWFNFLLIVVDVKRLMHDGLD